MELGQLSAKYESKGDPGAIGYDAGGGWSYGTNQIATRTGTFGVFLEFCKVHYPAIYERLSAAGGFAAADKGTDQFKAAWKQCAVDFGVMFAHCQHDFIVDSHYDVAINRLKKAKIDLSSPPRSHAVAEVIYSTTCMAGPGTPKVGGVGSCGLIFDALCSLKAVSTVAAVSDADLIAAIYDQKLKRIDNGKEYGKQLQNIRASVRKRIVSERVDALAMLAQEQAQSPQS